MDGVVILDGWQDSRRWMTFLGGFRYHEAYE